MKFWRVLGIVALAIAVPVLVWAAAAVVLPALGFTSAGVVGGSLAALAQSAIYGASTGGLFSVLQSIGATIVAPTAAEVVGAAFLAASGIGGVCSG
ncbi:hypothetical protein BV20DRAFT_1052768 [Pilatotrama ljubarskyi]|nr:hypothetical protein BV20DRAFT_1052768 [Pilatotrama ljubarskyi]